MFISKKRFEKALQEARFKVDDEMQRKWEMREEERYRNDRIRELEQGIDRRVDVIHRRIDDLEKQLGINQAKTHECPFAPKSTW